MSTIFWIFAGLISVMYLCCIAWVAYEFQGLKWLKKEKYGEIVPPATKADVYHTILMYKAFMKRLTWIWVGMAVLLGSLDLIINHITILGE